MRDTGTPPPPTGALAALIAAVDAAGNEICTCLVAAGEYPSQTECLADVPRMVA